MYSLPEESERLEITRDRDIDTRSKDIVD